MIGAPDSCKVYTPPALASAMVNAIRGEDGVRWLEPSVGKGVFLQALSKFGVPRNLITALDLDKAPTTTDRLANTKRGVESISWMLATKLRFERIVGNPPFVAIRHIHPNLQAAATSTPIPGTEKYVPLGANLWFAFLCSSIRVLKHSGSLAFVLPAAWDFADYAEPLRKWLPRQFASFYTIRCSRPLFEEVLDGSIVIVGLGFNSPHHLATRVDCQSFEDLCDVLHRIGSGMFVSKRIERESNKFVCEPSWRKLGDYLDIFLGGVTGHADFFLLSESERKQKQLPIASVRPVVSRAKHLVGAEIHEAQWRALRDQDEKVWLFYPTGKVLEHKNVKCYIEEGGCDKSRYKIRNRDPWYLTPMPSRVDGFMSGMNQRGPIISFKKMPGLNATNTLYGVRFKGNIGKEMRYSVALALLSTPVAIQIESKMRLYASGLRKLEPGDLAELRVPTLRRINSVDVSYCRAVHLLSKGEVRIARQEANKLLAVI